ncbi:MAG: ZIP family metal transporter [Acidobacteriota bacterium]|nr:ZIP family metal transporter [Acidobacteriota bacterium]
MDIASPDLTTSLIAVGLSILGSLGGLLTASLVLLVRNDLRTRLVPWLVSYAVGTLLGASLFNLLPEALAAQDAQTTMTTMVMLVSGILTFFVLEKIVLWHHCHDDEECAAHKRAASLVVIGDAVHTFVDGAVIAAATIVSPALGVTTALAVAAHEIPQEMGDAAILMSAGYSRKTALGLNLASAGGGVLGALMMLAFGAAIPLVIPKVLAFAAGAFLYVAMADLIPSLHQGRFDAGSFRQLGLIILGLLTLALL